MLNLFISVYCKYFYCLAFNQNFYILYICSYFWDNPLILDFQLCKLLTFIGVEIVVFYYKVLWVIVWETPKTRQRSIDLWCIIRIILDDISSLQLPFYVLSLSYKFSDCWNKTYLHDYLQNIVLIIQMQKSKPILVLFTEKLLKWMNFMMTHDSQNVTLKTEVCHLCGPDCHETGRSHRSRIS